MTKTTKWLVAGLLGTVALSGLAIAGPGGPGGGMRELIASLDLNDKQQEQVEAIRDDMKAFHEAQRAEKQRIGDAILAELEKARPDKERIHDLVDEGIDSLRDGMHDRVDAILDFHGTLSETQRTQLVDGLETLRDEREARHDERRGPHGGPPGGEPRGEPR